MAGIDDTLGIPTVAPETRVPDNYQHINVQPESFGAYIGQGLQRAGQGVEKAGDAAFDIRAFAGSVNVANSHSDFNDTRDRILYGDASKPATGPDGMPIIGPDGKPMRDTGYMGLEGRAAADQREATLKALRDARDAHAKGLTSAQEKLEYDNQTRRSLAEAERTIGAHADAQWKNWAGAVNERGADQALNAFAANVDNIEDPEAKKHHYRDYIDFKVKAAQTKYGNDPTITQATIDAAKRDLLKTEVEAVGAKDPARALRILESGKAIAGTQYDDLYNRLRDHADDETARTKAAEIVARSSGGKLAPTLNGAIQNVAAQTGLPAADLTRTVQLELGGNPHAQTGSYKGLTQLSDAEFNRYNTIPGASIWDPEANLRAGAAKMKAESDQFTARTGKPATGFDIYMVHQQGLAGYTAHLDRPDVPAWQNMLSTGEGRQKGEQWAKAAIWGTSRINGNGPSAPWTM